MGGGEGVGSLSDIVNSLYVELVMNGMDALVLVVCGRNEKLKKSLERRDWDDVLRIYSHMKTSKFTHSFHSFGSMCSPPTPTAAGCIEGSVTSSLRRILSTSSMGVDTAITSPPAASLKTQVDEEKKEIEPQQKPQQVAAEVEGDDGPPQLKTSYSFESFSGERALGNVAVVGLGFVTKMAEYMVAADVLVSKAGPGTISEAAALSLPVMLTSFLPGQEEGNVDYVLKGGFGAYVNDRDPAGIAEEVVMWLSDEQKLKELSLAAKAKGAPHAARDIAKTIGDSTLKWKEINAENGKASIKEILQGKKRTS
jgi:hypothetical protein